MNKKVEPWSSCTSPVVMGHKNMQAENKYNKRHRECWHIEMENQRRACAAHCVVLTYPAQGHLNPLLQFSKRLEHRGVKVTLVSTHFFWKSINTKEFASITIESISDGYDEEGYQAAESFEAYLKRFWEVGPQTLDELLHKLVNSGCPADCVIYDSFLPWALDIAKKSGLVGAAFLTQSCAVNNIYFHAHKGLVKLPLTQAKYLLPGLVELEPSDLPSFIYVYGSYPVVWQLVVETFSNIGKADWVLSNSVYELEQEVVDWIMKILPLRTIGPTVPSMFLDKRLQDDKDYGISIFNPNNEACMKWLNERSKGSVVYVSFGSLAALSEEQMEELAWGLRDSRSYFLWVVRSSEEAKLPKDFVDSSEKALVVTWCPQLEVLSHEAVGCFVTHCGWNSTLEALSLGVPMIAIPQWTDQSTNAKHIIDVWKTGLKPSANEKGIVRREAIEHCIREIMENERGKEIRNNATKWKSLARKAVDDGGSSDKNIEEFVAKLKNS